MRCIKVKSKYLCMNRKSRIFFNFKDKSARLYTEREKDMAATLISLCVCGLPKKNKTNLYV